MKMRPGFSGDRGLLGACAVVRFFQLSDFIRLSRKSRVALIEGNIIIQQSYFLVAVYTAPLACRSLSLQIIPHHLSPIAIASFPGGG